MRATITTAAVALLHVHTFACSRSTSGAGPVAPVADMPAAQNVAGASAPRPDAESAVDIPDLVAAQMQASVVALSSGLGEPASDELASALGSLAAALELLPGATWAHVQRVREAARDLDRHASDAGSGTQLVEVGLEAVARVLVEVERPKAREVQFQSAVAPLGAAIDALDPGKPVSGQKDTILHAYQSAADAILLASGRAGRFGKPATVPTADHPDSFSSRGVAVASAVEKLAQAGIPDRRRIAADALSALADALEAAPGRSDIVAAALKEIRFQAERLRRADPLSFGDTQWIQKGLESAVDALEALPSGRAAGLKPWLAAARRSVQAIAAGRSLSFQLAAVQDAFRTVADAFQAVAQRCGCG